MYCMLHSRKPRKSQHHDKIRYDAMMFNGIHFKRYQDVDEVWLLRMEAEKRASVLQAHSPDQSGVKVDDTTHTN